MVPAPLVSADGGDTRGRGLSVAAEQWNLSEGPLSDCNGTASGSLSQAHSARLSRGSAGKAGTAGGRPGSSSSSPGEEDVPGNAVSSVRAEKGWWAQGWGRRGRQLGPRGFREPPHSSHRASTAESSLGCGRSGCVSRSSLWSFLPTGGKRAKDHSPGLLLCTHTPSPHPASSPRGSRLLLGGSPAPFLLGAPWLGLRILLLLLLLLFRPCQFSLKSPGAKDRPVAD